MAPEDRIGPNADLWRADQEEYLMKITGKRDREEDEHQPKAEAKKTKEEKKKLIAKSGWIAGFGLFAIYAGLILLGSYFSSEIDIDMSLDSDHKRAALLRGISLKTLGNIGTAFLSVLVGINQRHITFKKDI